MNSKNSAEKIDLFSIKNIIIMKLRNLLFTLKMMSYRCMVLNLYVLSVVYYMINDN
jgi:hypothetical protein